MIEAFPKRPNAAEYVEVVKHKVDEQERRMSFEFTFPGRLDEEALDTELANPTGTLHDVIMGHLRNKGWVNVDDTALVPMSADRGRSADMKTWTLNYYRKD